MLDMQVTQVYSMFTVTAPTETGLNTQKGRGMEMDTSKSRIGFAFALLAVVAVSGISAKAQAWNDGPSIYSNQGKYLGNLNSNQFDPNSVSNNSGGTAASSPPIRLITSSGGTAASFRPTHRTIRMAEVCRYMVTTRN